MPSKLRSGEAKVWPEAPGKKVAGGEGAGEASTAVFERADSSTVLETVQDQDESHVWTCCSSNAYGAFIHVALQAGLMKAMTLTLPMVMVSTLVQAVFSFQLLWTHWNDFSLERQQAYGAQLCNTPWIIQACATMIFATLMLNNVGGMWKAARLALFSTHHAGGDGETMGKYKQEDMGNKVMPLNRNRVERLCIFVFGVFLEWATWGLLCVAGIVWINSATDVDLVIRSTVSMMFVLNVDELIYEACCMSDIIQDVEETKYRVLAVNPNLIQMRISSSFRTRYLVRSIVFSGHGLAARDSSVVHGRTSDAYLVLYQDGKKIGKTEVVLHNLNPLWPRLTVKLRLEGQILIKCFDYDVLSKDDYIGEVLVQADDFRSMQSDQGSKEFQLTDKHAGDTGRIRIEELEDASLTRVSSWYVMKHFVDVYLYLFFLIGLSFGVTAYFKEVVLEDCSLRQATYW